MKIEFVKNNKISEFEMALETVSKDAKSILILSCDKNNYVTNSLNTILKKHTIPVIGGIFPQIIYKNKSYEEGTIIASLDDELNV